MCESFYLENNVFFLNVSYLKVKIILIFNYLYYKEQILQPSTTECKQEQTWKRKSVARNAATN